MSTPQMLIALAALLLFGILPILICAVLLPSMAQADERRRVEREQQAASWRIHQATVAGFAEMLHAARESEQ